MGRDSKNEGHKKVKEDELYIRKEVEVTLKMKETKEGEKER
jgi:hypothetical protein